MAQKQDAFQRYLHLPLEDPDLRKYLRGDTLVRESAIQNGLTAVCADDFILGWGNSAGGVIKNMYPKVGGEWIEQTASGQTAGKYGGGQPQRGEATDPRRTGDDRRRMRQKRGCHRGPGAAVHLPERRQNSVQTICIFNDEQARRACCPPRRTAEQPLRWTW